MTCVEWIVETFSSRGLRYLFGIPGSGVSLELIDAASGRGIDFVLTAHEGAAGIMAAVQGELTGIPGVCLSIRGPGAVNLNGGLAYAWLEQAPLLAITETYSHTPSRPPPMQSLDHRALFTPTTKQREILTPDTAGMSVQKLWQEALRERPGPVHLDVPSLDIPVEASEEEAQQEPEPRFPNIETVADRLRRASTPVAVAGAACGRTEAGEALVAWAEAWSIPVMVSAKAKGLFPEDHPLFGGVFLAQGSAERHMTDRADLFITIGLDRRELLQDWPYEQPTVLLDCIDQGKAQLCNPQARAIGNLPDILNALSAAGAQKWAAGDVAEVRRQIQEQLAPKGPGFWPQQVIEITRRLSPRDAILAIETGIYNMPAEYLWTAYTFRTYLGTVGARTMGFALPAALSAALVCDGQQVICMVGDGGLLMRAGELELAGRMQLPVIVVVFNDSGLGTIRSRQAARGFPQKAVDLGPVDIAKMAQACGCHGARVETAADYERAFSQALKSREPVVIDVKMEPEIYDTVVRQVRG